MPKRSLGLIAILGLIGLGLTGYLFIPHLGLMRGEIIGGAVCGQGGLFSCHIVTASRWGSFMGAPLALWGFVGYGVLIGLALLGRQSEEAAKHSVVLIGLLALVFVLADLFLLGVMAFVIGSWCPLCLATYVVNGIILVSACKAVAAADASLFGGLGGAIGYLIPSVSRPGTHLFWGMTLMSVAGAVGLHLGTIYISRGSLKEDPHHFVHYIQKQERVAVDTSGDPHVGSPNAPLQVVEFSDLRCPVCQRAFKLNRIMLTNHKAKVNFIYKHYPLDTSCNDAIQRQVHPGACELAAATECAHKQGKFWELHDLIFEKGKDYKISNLNKDVKALGLSMSDFDACMDSGEGMEAVKRDIAAGKQIEVRSTPTYVLNGVRISGVLSPSTFNGLSDALLDPNEHRAH